MSQNLLEKVISLNGVMLKDYKVLFDQKEFDCVDYGFDDNEEIDVVLRPEDLDIVERGMGKISGVIESVIFKGVHYEMRVKCEHRSYLVHTTDFVEIGKKVDLDFYPEDIHVMSKMGGY